MARPQNEKLKAAITAAVERQFLERGYRDTSYRSIAEECGISRNLVQYHFPKKEKLAEAFMESLLRKSMRELGFSEADLHGDFKKIKAVGVLYFETLMASSGSRQFLQDVLASRDMTEDILAFNMDWALDAVGATPATKKDVQQSIVVHMGGFYELLYWALRHDEQIDLAGELDIVVDAFKEALVRS